MRIFAIIILALVGLGRDAFAQQPTETVATQATPIEKVLDANPEPDGKAYRIDLLLKNGERVLYEIPPPEAAKIADGLSKPAIAGGLNKQVAALVYGMSIQVDSKGLAVILSPEGRSGPLESLAIPIEGADQFLAVLRTKITEARSVAAQQSKKP